MKTFVLYCKSYRNDMLRIQRLARSVQQFNQEKIPFYVSVPLADFALFEKELTGLPVELIKDEDIIRANPSLDQSKVDALPGGYSQQIVKSEFWRLGISDSYLCIDSDCLFIRPFAQSDFITPEGYPYTLIHEAKELLQFSINHGMEKVCDVYHEQRRKIMEIFGRIGPHFDYGPSPMLWSSKVWAALDEQFLKPKNMSFHDAILLFPSEILWYGEAMLKFRPLPITPVEPFFKVYYYEKIYIVGKQQGETVERLARDYMGVCYQSNWERNFDFDKKPMLSRMARWIRRKIFRRYT